MPIKEQVAVVVGGTGNIGKNIVLALLSSGYNTAVIARGMDNFDALSDCFSVYRKQISLHRYDITFEKKVQRCFKEIKNARGRIDYLIYTVGLKPDMEIPLLEYSTNDWYKTFNTYVTGFLFCFREGLRTMEKGGHIIAVSSAITRFITATLPPIHAGHYAAAKAAFNELCKWGRREAHERGILLSRIAPGAVEMPFHRTAPTKQRPPALLPMQVVVEKIINALIDCEEIDQELVAEK